MDVNQPVNVLLDQMIELMRLYQEATHHNATLEVRKKLRLQIKELQKAIEDTKANQHIQESQQT